MNKKPLVSIIMPAYNAQKFIAESIDSVLKQSYENWELIIADNNSKDKTVEIIKSYASDDSRVKYVKAFDKQGAAYARNLAIEVARGDYIAFLDSDDLWFEDKLEKHIAFMQENDLVLSYTSYQAFGERDHVVRNAEKASYKEILKHNVIGCSTAVYNLKKLKQKYYMPMIRNGQDWCLWCNILKDSRSVAMRLDEVLTLYRIDENSLSANKLKCAYYHYKALRHELKVGLLKSIYCFMCYAVINLKKVASLQLFLRMLGIRKNKKKATV